MVNGENVYFVLVLFGFAKNYQQEKYSFSLFLFFKRVIIIFYTLKGIVTKHPRKEGNVLVITTIETFITFALLQQLQCRPP